LRIREARQCFPTVAGEDAAAGALALVGKSVEGTVDDAALAGAAAAGALAG